MDGIEQYKDYVYIYNSSKTQFFKFVILSQGIGYPIMLLTHGMTMGGNQEFV